MKCILCNKIFEDTTRAIHDHFIDHHQDVQAGMAEYIIALQRKVEELERRMQQYHGPPDT